MLPPLLILPACAHQTPTAAIDNGCGEFQRITFDRLADTMPTIVEIKAYDAERDAVCGVGK
jgi:hypothetical protein